jgi:hypothetical protein
MNEPFKSPEEIELEVQAANTDAKQLAKKEAYDRTTVVAFGLLFILPALVIVFSMIFVLPLIARSVQEEPSGATTLRSNSGDLTPPNR